MPRTLACALNLALLIAFPIAWLAPMLKTGLTHLWGGTQISILQGLQTLWQTDIVLALIVAIFAILAPIAKTIALALHHAGRLPPRAKPALITLSRLAMADIFLIALGIITIKGSGIGYVETAWGLWLFCACVLISLTLSLVPTRQS